MTYAYNKAVEETMQLTPYNILYGRRPTTTLDAMLAVGTDEEDLDVAIYLERDEGARQLTRLRTKNQPSVERCHYNLP